MFLSWLPKVKGDDFRGCSDLFWSGAPLLWNFVPILLSLFKKIYLPETEIHIANKSKLRMHHST